METLQQKSVYPSVIEGFRNLGVRDADAVSRTVLLRGGFFAGQKFECEGYQAIVPVAGDSVAFYSQDGELLRSMEVAAITPARMAA